MSIIQNIVNELDLISDITEKKKYLNDELKKPTLSENKRLAIRLMVQDNFIDNYYKFGLVEKLQSFIKSLFH
jgi:hypothetical protein